MSGQVLLPLDRIVELLNDESDNPCRSLIKPPVSVHAKMAIEAAQTKLVDCWNAFHKQLSRDEGIRNEQDMARQILVYALNVLKVATDIKEGKYCDGLTEGEVRKITTGVVNHLRRVGIQPIAGKTWRMGAPQVHFGDMANLNALEIQWYGLNGHSKLRGYITTRTTDKSITLFIS